MKDKSFLNRQYGPYLMGFSLLLLLPIMLIPPWFFPPDWGKTILFRIVFLLLLLFFAYQILWEKNKGIGLRFTALRKKPIFWLLLGLFGAYLIATIFSLDPHFSLWGSPFRGGGFVNYTLYILFAIGTYLAIPKDHWQRMWSVAIAGGIAVSVIALISRLGLFPAIFIQQTDALSSTLGSPSSLGIYLLLLIFPTVGLGLKEERVAKKIFYFASAVLFLIILVLTISQGAYLGVAAGTVYFLLLYPKKTPRLKLVLLGILLLGVIGVVVIRMQPKDSINQNYIFSNIANWHLDQSRISAWKVAATAIVHRPLLGYGPDNFSIGFDKYYNPAYPGIQKDPSTSGSWWDRPHDIVLNVLSDAGIVGLIAYIAFFATLFFQLYRVKTAENQRSVTGHMIQATLIAYFVDLIFNFDISSSYIILFFIIGYAFSLLALAPDMPTVPQTRNKAAQWFITYRNFVFGALTVGGIVFIWLFAINPFNANAQVNIAQIYIDHQNCDLGLAVMDQAANTHTVIDSYFNLKYVEFLRSCAIVQPQHAADDINKSIALLKDNVVIMPYYTRNWIYLGALTNLLIAQEQDPAAKQALITQADGYFTKAFALSPLREEVFLEWIKEDIVAGNYQTAVDKSNTCLGLNPNSADCYWLRGVAHIYLGDFSAGQQDLALADQKGYSSSEKVAALNQLADAYAARKNYPALIQTYEKLVQIRPDIAQYHSALAWTYQQVGRYLDARHQVLDFLHYMPGGIDEAEAFIKQLPAPYNQNLTLKERAYINDTSGHPVPYPSL